MPIAIAHCHRCHQSLPIFGHTHSLWFWFLCEQGFSDFRGQVQERQLSVQVSCKTVKQPDTETEGRDLCDGLTVREKEWTKLSYIQKLQPYKKSCIFCFSFGHRKSYNSKTNKLLLLLLSSNQLIFRFWVKVKIRAFHHLQSVVVLSTWGEQKGWKWWTFCCVKRFLLKWERECS